MRNLSIDSLRDLSQIFTTSNFDKVVRHNDIRYTAAKVKRHFNSQNHTATFQGAIKCIYDEMQKGYKNEYLFKNILLNKLVLNKYCLKKTTVLNEFKIGNSIADFVMLNGEAQIFEIKTDLDGLDKLAKQLVDYCQFADKVFIVVSSKFISKLTEVYANTTIGIIELTEQNELKQVKSAMCNLGTFDHTIIFKTLRQKEYTEVIQELHGSIPQVPNTRLFRECLELSKTFDISKFQKIVFRKLKERKLKRPDLLKSDQTPFELKHICHTLDLTSIDYINLFEFLNKPLSQCTSHT